MTTPKSVEEIIRSIRPSLLPTSDEMVAYERRIITALTTYSQSRYEEGVNAERGRCKELVAAHLRTNTYEGNDARVFKTTIEEVVGLLYDNK